MDERFDDIRQKALRFRDDRDWAKYHDPKNLAEAIAIESGELLENFLWKTSAESRNLSRSEMESVGQEVADVLIYLIYLCEQLNIDMHDEVTKKLKINEKRFLTEVERLSEGTTEKAEK